MNAQLRRAAKACLFSTVTGLLLTSDGLVLADIPGRIRHADAEVTTDSEPSPLATLGEARPIPVPTRPEAGRPAAQKSTTASKSNKTKTKAKPNTAAAKRPATAPTASPSKNAAPATAGSGDESSIEQTAGSQGRAYPSQRPGPALALPAATPATQPSASSSSMSPIERELEELYRKNGRQMPEMNMQEFQAPQPETAPSQMPAQNSAGRPANYSSAMSGPQPGVRPTKPNFFERVFGFGRSRSKTMPRTSAPQGPRTGAAPANSSYGPYVPNSSRPAQQTMPFRPTPTPATAPATAPTTAPTAAPVQRQQALPTREPTPLGPAGAPIPQFQQPASRSSMGLNGADGQPLLDESKVRGDSESLELSQDDETPAGRRAPQILPNQSANGSTESPYTGLKITPNESEDNIARSDELGKELSEESPAKGSAPAASPKGTVTRLAPVTTDTSLRHPLAGTAKAAPAAPAARTAPRADDDELMELDDEDDDEEDDDDDAKRSRAPAEETLTIPGDEKPVFPRETAGSRSGVSADAKPATGSTGAPAGKEAEKVAVALQKGFKGFCPVILKDERRLVEARSQFKSEYRGRTYTFSSIEAKQTFDEDPKAYVPAEDGNDVVRQAGGELGIEGSLEHAAWYRGKLYLFSSAASRREFVDAPARFNVKE